MLLSYKNPLKRDLFLASALKLPFMEVYNRGLKNCATVYHPQTVKELNTLNRSTSIFDDESDEPLIIDITELGFDVEYYAQFNPESTYFFSTIETQPKAASVKSMLKFEQHMEKIETIPEIELKLLTEICTKYGINNSELVKKTSEIKVEIEEKVLLLEYALLTSNPLNYVKNFKPDFTLPLFMRGFALTHDSITSWYKAIKTEDEVQLGLSLLFGKLNKMSTESSKKALETLIETDYLIKTNNNFSGVLAFHSMLHSFKKYV
jgi:hypothetical protein